VAVSVVSGARSQVSNEIAPEFPKRSSPVADPILFGGPELGEVLSQRWIIKDGVIAKPEPTLFSSGDTARHLSANLSDGPAVLRQRQTRYKCRLPFSRGNALEQSEYLLEILLVIGSPSREPGRVDSRSAAQLMDLESGVLCQSEDF